MRLGLDPKTNIVQPFPTYIGRFQVPNASEVNPVLERIILEREARDQGTSKSNIGGWHSSIDFHEWPEVAQTDIVESFHSAVSHMVATAAGARKFNLKCHFVSWANVNRRGSHNTVHNHARAHWSGVYYVKIPQYSQDDSPRAGKLALYDPRGAVNMVPHPGKCVDGEAVEITPSEGAIVLFPSWLYHSVHPFNTDAVRISIAFNATVDYFEELKT